MNELSNKRIFLTGGTGFFGKWLLDHFHPSAAREAPFLRGSDRRERQRLETEVVVLSRNPAQFLRDFPRFGPERSERGSVLAGQRPKGVATNENITFVRGDVRDFSFPSGHFDYVIHAATEASVKLDQENPDEMFSVIVDGTRRVLEFSKQAGVQRLLYVSSGAVYGVQPPELSHIPETFPCNPVTAYGKGKLKAEQMCLESGIETVIARCFAFVGPWLPLDTYFAIGNFIGNCRRNEPIEIKGDGTPLRSYMYGSDLAEWLLMMLLRGRSGEAYNVGSDEAICIADLARMVRSVAGTDNEIRVCQKTDSGMLPARYVPDIRKARGELGLRLQVGLQSAITKTVEWRGDRML